MRQVVVTVRNGSGQLIWSRGPVRDRSDDFRVSRVVASNLCASHNRSRSHGDQSKIWVYVEEFVPRQEQRSLPL